MLSNRSKEGILAICQRLKLIVLVTGTDAQVASRAARSVRMTELSARIHLGTPVDG